MIDIKNRYVSSISQIIMLFEEKDRLLSLNTVAGNCFGSPIRTHLVGFCNNGIRVDTSVAWHASSITNTEKLYQE